MDVMAEEQVDYEDGEFAASPLLQHYTTGAVQDDDEFDGLYSDVSVDECFMQSWHHQNEVTASLSTSVNSAVHHQKTCDSAVHLHEPNVPLNENAPRIRLSLKNSAVKHSHSSPEEQQQRPYILDKSVRGRENMEFNRETLGNNMGCQTLYSMPPKIGADPIQVPSKYVNDQSTVLVPGAESCPLVQISHEVTVMDRPVVDKQPNKLATGTMDKCNTMLFVGELQWWTTDAELEDALSKYGIVKEIKFFDERASGKSKGFCQVEFLKASEAAACKEGMNGHVLNGRACVVAFASQQTLKQMGTTYFNRSQPQGRRFMNDGIGRGMYYHGGNAGRSCGRARWNRSRQGVFNQGQWCAEPMRGRGLMGGRGNSASCVSHGINGVVPFGQTLKGTKMGVSAGGMIHSQGLMGTIFDTSYAGQLIGYTGFAGATFPGMIPSFQTINNAALAGVAPHVNPAFFGRGISNGMSLIGSNGVDDHAGMWPETSMADWKGEGHGRRIKEFSYGSDGMMSENGRGEMSHERGRSTSTQEERSSERASSAIPIKRHHEERDLDWDGFERENCHNERAAHRDYHGFKEDGLDNNGGLGKGHDSSQFSSNSGIIPESDPNLQCRDAYHGKRQCLP